MAHTHKTTGGLWTALNACDGVRSGPFTCSETLEIKVSIGKDTFNPPPPPPPSFSSSFHQRPLGVEDGALTVTDRHGARAEKLQIRYKLVRANNLRPSGGSCFPATKQNWPSIWPGSPVVQWYIRTIASVFLHLFLVLVFFVVVYVYVWVCVFVCAFLFSAFHVASLLSAEIFSPLCVWDFFAACRLKKKKV